MPVVSVNDSFFYILVFFASKVFMRLKVRLVV